MNELKKLLENAGILKEYLTQEGDTLANGVLGLNVFTDMAEGQRPSEYEEDFAASRQWMHIEQKYTARAEEAERALAQGGDRILDEYEVEEIHDVWYDGSDAYGDVETALEELPSLYDSQIELVYELLSNDDMNEGMSDEEGDWHYERLKDKEMDERWREEQERKKQERGGVDEASGEAMDDHIVDGNIEKITKTLASTAALMDKRDRPGVDNPSKSNVSVYINFILEQVIDSLQMSGYEVNWEEKDWD